MAAAPPADRQPLIHPSSPAAAAAWGSACRQERQQQLAPTWVYGLALLLFVTTAAVAIVDNRRAPWRVAFVVGVSVNVVALFGALAAYDRAPPEGTRRTRRKLKAAVWALATALNLAYSLRAAAAAASAAASFAVGCTATFVAFAGARMLVVEGGDGPDAGGEESPNEPAGGEGRRREPLPAWLLWLAMLFFSANAAVAAVGQPRRVVVVVQVSVNVLALFGSLGAYDGAPPEEARRARLVLRAIVWALATSLSGDFYF